MDVYNFDRNTGIYLGSMEARESPLEPGVFLLPAHATFQAPPIPGSGQAAFFSPVLDEWRLGPAPETVDTPVTPEVPTPPEVLRREKYNDFHRRLLISSVWQQKIFPAILGGNTSMIGAIATFRFVQQDIRDGIVEPDANGVYGGLQQTLSALLAVAGEAISPADIEEVELLLVEVGLGGLYDFTPLEPA